MGLMRIIEKTCYRVEYSYSATNGNWRSGRSFLLFADSTEDAIDKTRDYLVKQGKKDIKLIKALIHLRYPDMYSHTVFLEKDHEEK